MNKLTISPVALTFLARTPSCMRVTLAAALLLAAVLVPSASAQFIYVANAGEDTVSKIDINSNTEVARYATWFTAPDPNHVPHLWNAWTGPAPSRIAQDSAGNAYVLNRFFSPHLPVLLKIAPAGGTPGTDTSNAPTMVLPITETISSTPVHIDPGETKDVRIQWAKEIGTPGAGPAGDDGALGRAVCIDTTGALWVGMFTTQRYYKVNSATGVVIGGPIKTPGHTPYGCQVDMNGKLWSVDENDTVANTLAEIDTNASTPVATIHPIGIAKSNYSLSIFNDCSSSPPKVKVYLSDRSASPKTYRVYDPQTSSFSSAPGSVPAFDTVAVAVDSNGDIISGDHFVTGRIIKTNASGSVVWTQPGTGHPIADLHGIIVDANNDVWAIDLNGNQVIKYSGASGAFIKAVTVGNMPYTYGNPPPPTCTGASPSPTPGPISSPTPVPPGCAQVADKDVLCGPNGSYSYTFTATNNTGGDMSQILLTPLPGSAFTLNRELFSLPSLLHNGQSVTLTVNIGNVKPGDNVCFFASLMADKTACCTVKVCPTLPKCADTTYPTTPPRPPQPVKRRR